ncbi:hypothetical protein [Pandoravirus japonicus]|uniref:Transmembrane protein n=1 Tax=Pandoravirus japonicus TaxID=2823154 RepID=A0A811BN05_9VIRU|nr:hypothetical protein [Pandoravirus japonicus]
MAHTHPPLPLCLAFPLMETRCFAPAATASRPRRHRAWLASFVVPSDCRFFLFFFLACFALPAFSPSASRPWWMRAHKKTRDKGDAPAGTAASERNLFFLSTLFLIHKKLWRASLRCAWAQEKAGATPEKGERKKKEREDGHPGRQKGCHG